MYCLIDETGAIAKRTSASTVEWRGLTISNLAALSPEDRRATGVYLQLPATVHPGEFERAMSAEYDIDHEAGTVQERFIIAQIPLAEARARLIGRVKTDAAQRLSVTDWKITRSAEGVKPCDQATLDHRAAIRAASDAYEVLVLAAQTTAALAGLAVQWPD